MSARFVIIAAQRTGSNFLVQVLCRHPSIHCFDELFNKAGIPLGPKQKQFSGITETEEELMALRDRDPQAFLERFMTADVGRPIMGFKIFENHNAEILERVTNDPAYAKILLYRPNVLACYASSRAARVTGDYHRMSDRTVTTFDAGDLVAFHNAYVAFFRAVARKLDASGQPYHFLRYDALNDESAVMAVFRFLGAPAEMPATMPKKPPRAADTDVLRRFSNPREARAFLRTRGLLHWQREGEPSSAPIGEPL